MENTSNCLLLPYKAKADSISQIYSTKDIFKLYFGEGTMENYRNTTVSLEFRFFFLFENNVESHNNVDDDGII